MSNDIQLPPPMYEFGSYSIPVSPALLSVPERILSFADKTEFNQKSELRVTVLSKKKLERTGADQFIAEIEDIINDTPSWEASLQNKYYLMAKRSQDGSTKQSIIQMVSLPALEELYDMLRREKLLSDETPTPPAHITLFTKYDDSGIDIDSRDDFDDYLIRQIY